MPDGNVALDALHQADPVDIEVGARIRLRRQQLKLSQADLAAFLGVSFQQVQKYERGANRVSASMLKRTAQKLKTPVAWFFGEAGDAEPLPNEILALLNSAKGKVLLRNVAVLEGERLDALVRVSQALAGGVAET